MSRDEAQQPRGFQPYQYNSLPNKTSIRLIRLQDTIEATGHICVSFKTVDLHDETSFDEHQSFGALSYTWGHPRTVYWENEPVEQGNGHEKTCQVFCEGNNQVLWVTANLYNFLLAWKRMPPGLISCAKYHHELPMRPIPAKPIWLWIDAICINQSDISERGQQVAIMWEIYLQSNAVWIWLGPSDVSVNKAVQNVIKLSNIDESITELLQIPKSGRGRREATPNLSDPTWRAMLGFDDDDLRGIFEFFNRSWFHRSWILQELAYGSACSPAIVLVGDTCLSWTVILEAWVFLDRSALDYAIKERYRDKRAFVPSGHDHVPSLGHSIFAMASLQARLLHNMNHQKAATSPEISKLLDGLEKEIRVSEHLNWTLLDLLHEARDLKATDPRDKVFAFLMLSKLFEAENEQRYLTMAPLYPDYESQVQKLFLDTAWYMLSFEGLKLLTFVQEAAYTNITGMPSWVPDWTVSLTPNPLSPDYILRESPSLDVRWAAAGTHDWVPIRPRMSTLDVQGWQLDIISSVTDQHHVMLDTLETVEKGLRTLVREVTAIGLLMEIAMQLPQVYPWAWSTTRVRKHSSKTDWPPKGSGGFVMEFVNPDESVEVPMAQSRIEALWRVMIADSIGGTSPAPLKLGFGFGDLMTDIVQRAEIEYVCETGKAGADKARLELLERLYLQSNKAYKDALGSELASRSELLEDPLQPFHSVNEANRNSGVEATFPSMGLGFIPPRSVWHGENPELIRANKAAWERVREFMTRSDVIGASRRVYRTSNDFLGIGSRSLQNGDEVWILAGADVPIILRPCDDGMYRFIGETFVHGVMNGEALRFHDFKFASLTLK